MMPSDPLRTQAGMNRAITVLQREVEEQGHHIAKLTEQLNGITDALNSQVQEANAERSAVEPKRVISRGEAWDAMYRTPDGTAVIHRSTDGQYACEILPRGGKRIVLQE